MGTDCSLVHSGLKSNQIQWKWGNTGVIYNLLGNFGILIQPSFIGYGLISVSPPLYLVFYLAFVSTRLDMNLDPIWDNYHHMTWWLGIFNYYGWKTQASQDLVKSNLSHHTSRSSSDTGIHNDLQYHLVRRLAEEFSGHYEGSHVLYVFLLSIYLHVTQV